MALYENFLYSNFPESIDSYEYMQDITLDTYELVKQYEILINQKKFNEASQYLIDHPELDRSMFNAIKYNKLIDSIKSIETLYSADVRKYILELMSFKGEYSNLQKYIRYNVVNYDSMIYLCILDCPLGTLPTDTKYWYPLSIKGEKGVGIGLSFNGLWQANFTYNKDSCVTYNNVLYVSKIDDNIGRTPSINSEYWSVIFDISQFATYDNSSSGLSSVNLQGAIDEVNIKVNTNTSSVNTINTKLNTIEQGAQKNTITGIKGANESSYRTGNVNITKENMGLGNVDNTKDLDKSVKNSDTVDGFHFQVSTTDLEAGVSSLATNVFYFVYE